MKVREPVARPLDVVAIEMLLSASQAFLAGVMLYLAVGIWDDRGVSVGSVAIILGLLALAVGGGWLYWLMGGAGWPLAAANVPSSMFLAFAIILGWQGDGLIRLDPFLLVLALAASIFGIVAGVFLDSPRRWRWDQRQRLRPGTAVPPVSEATRAALARVPRSLPSRSAADAGPAAPGTVPAPAPATSPRPRVDELDAPRASDDLQADSGVGVSATQAAEPGSPGAGDDAAASQPTPPAPSRSFAPKVEPIDPLARTGSTSKPPSAGDRDPARGTGEAIELPTSVEPKAQRSPWAWAAPPEWTRDEADEQGNSSRPGSAE